MSTNYKRPIIPFGNSFTLYVHVKKYDNGEYVEFDLTTAKSLSVELICASHNTHIPLKYTISQINPSILECPVDWRLLHTNTSYGCIVEGDYEDGNHFRWAMLPKEGLLVINNTSGTYVPDTVEYVDIAARVGFGVMTDGDLTNYYTKDETDNLLEDKQDLLVSGTNIKTINNESILGSGNIDIQIPEQVQANWNETDLTNPAYIQNKPNLSNYVTDNELQAELSNYVQTEDLSTYVTDGELQTELENYVDNTELTQHLATKQDTLVSGTNIKTINNQSILGEGNIDIQGGGGDFPEEEFNNIHKVVAEALFDHNSKISNLQSKVNNQTDVIEDLKSDIPELIDTNIDNIEMEVNSSNRTIAEVVTNLNNRVEVLEEGGGGSEQVQANWNETDTSAPSYIQNKPTIPTTTSELTNDSGFLTSAVESFNGQTGVVTYTAPVTSVNGMTGAVTIDAGVTSFNGQTGVVTYTAPVTSVNGMTGAVTIQTGAEPIYYINLNYEYWPQNGNNKQAIRFDNIELWNLTTNTKLYTKSFSLNRWSIIKNELSTNFNIRLDFMISDTRTDISNLPFSMRNGYYYLLEIPFTFAGTTYGNGDNLHFHFYGWDDNNNKQLFECNTIDIPLIPGYGRLVTSSTSNLKIEVVSALPATQENNVIYIVTSQNS